MYTCVVGWGKKYNLNIVCSPIYDSPVENYLKALCHNIELLLVSHVT